MRDAASFNLFLDNSAGDGITLRIDPVSLPGLPVFSVRFDRAKAAWLADEIRKWLDRTARRPDDFPS